MHDITHGISRSYKGNRILLITLLYLILQNIVSDMWGWNASDVLAYAKHFVDPNWIKNDWFLNLPICYRYFFNVFAGIMALKMPFCLVEITGRLAIYISFAYLFQKFASLFELPWYLVVCFLCLYLAFPDIVAGEWIIGGFETKSFAYFFVLLSLYYFIEKRYALSWFSLGLSASFHVLVGIYASFCVLLTLIINHENFICDLKNIVKYAPLYFVSSILGIYSVLKVLTANRGTDTKLAGIIYVTLRVPHHTLPSFWTEYRGGHWWIFELVILLVFLLGIFVLSKDSRYKITSSFALTSSILFFVGLILFSMNKIYLLRYYWFRFPDVIIPLFSFFLFFSLLSDLCTKYAAGSSSRQLPMVRFRRFLKYIPMTASVIILALAAVNFGNAAIEIKNNPEYFRFDTKSKELRDALLWIRNHTDKNSTFLVSPFVDEFYMVAERPMFVSFKHVPASEQDIIEWHNRLKLCNNNNELHGRGFKEQDDREFYNLQENYIKWLAIRYKLDYYLGKPNMPYTFPKVFENSSYALYKLHQ